MSLKQQIYTALQNPDFPDLQFLYSSEALAIAPEILEELLEEEKNDFQKKLEIPDSEISFDTFDDVSILDYYFSLLEHYQGVLGDDTIRTILEDFEPLYIDFGNEAAYSQRYYEMLKICLETCDLDTEQTKIISEGIEHFEVRGIALPEDKQEELKSISKKLSEIQQRFSNNVVDSKKSFEYIITNELTISDMPADDKQVAQRRAQKSEKEGFLFDSSQGSYMSIMKYCSDNQVRKDFYEARQQVATSGEFNNKPLILEILTLRERKAEILGFNNYAELSLKFKMAESPEQIIALFSDISEKAKPKAQSELDEIREYFNLQDLQNWDVSYYANKLREEKYDFDSKKLKEYFVFENVLTGMFETISRLYNLEFKEIVTSKYNEDVTVYEVYRD
jgi:oligopeptidase A